MASTALGPQSAALADPGPTPAEFLTEVLDSVEHRAYYADRVDWTQWHVDAAAEAAQAQETSDTYDFVRRLLFELGDHHSRFFPPPTEPVDSAASTPFTAPSGSVDTDSIGRLWLPGFSYNPARDDDYIVAAHIVLATPACGWIIDLRGDRGGNIWPMLAALAPLLGAGPLLAYQYRDGSTELYALDERGAVISPDGAVFAAPADDRPIRFATGLPIAVIQGPDTASSGEGVVMALRGRPGVRSFGRPTAGVPTGNTAVELSDGSAINLTVAVGVDFGGQTHETAIAPDVEVTGSADAADTARSWLASQPECQS
jgi:carboxyl-terminal processing protease